WRSAWLESTGYRRLYRENLPRLTSLAALCKLSNRTRKGGCCCSPLVLRSRHLHSSTSLKRSTIALAWRLMRRAKEIPGERDDQSAEASASGSGRLNQRLAGRRSRCLRQRPLWAVTTRPHEMTI